MAKFNLADMAVEICPNNRIFTDDTGLPSAVVYIPKFKNSDVMTSGDDNTHPAFIVNGVEIPGFYYSKYQNVVHEGVAYSLPCETPHEKITFDVARESCEAKGHGWHLSTNAEWAAIALWCMKNGFLPKGNNSNGSSERNGRELKVIPATYQSGKIATVKTGTGPLTWSHDGTEAGIWDMHGNVWERQGGLRIVWGEVQILANNDAANPKNSQSATSTCWKAINAAKGTLVDPECKTTDTADTAPYIGETVRLTRYADGKWIYSTVNADPTDSPRSCDFGDVWFDAAIGTKTRQLLTALALLPDSGPDGLYDYGSMIFNVNNGTAECLPMRGGFYGTGDSAGIFSLFLTIQRDSATGGLRSSYVAPDAFVITFTIQGGWQDAGEPTCFTCDAGLTWAEYVGAAGTENFTGYGLKIVDGLVKATAGTTQLYTSTGVEVKATDQIINGEQYLAA